jgi:hypothetical protein
MMPSTSKKQHNFMEAIAHNKAFAKKVGVPQSVGQEFSKADKGKTFKEGGQMKNADLMQDKKMIKRAIGMHDKQEHKGEHTDLSKLKKGGNVKKMVSGGQPDPRAAAMMAKKRQAMMMGGAQAPARPMAPAGMAPSTGATPTMPMKKGGKVKKMASGGMTSMGKVRTGSGINGVAERGLTKGKTIKMAGGGSGKKYC